MSPLPGPSEAWRGRGFASRMSLDEYRDQLMERLMSCPDTAAARTLLAEAELVLVHARLTVLTQSKFWESLQEDLTAIADAAGLSADRKADVKLAALVAAAHARIARYRERLSDESARDP